MHLLKVQSQQMMLVVCQLQQDREKYSERLGRWSLEDIHKFMDLLDMPRGSGNKVLTKAHTHL